MKLINNFLLILGVIGLLHSCKEENKKKTAPTPVKTQTAPVIKRPEFSADNAYNFIQKQIDFGHRVPGTTAHKKAKNYLVEQLKKVSDKVTVQEAKATVYTGKNVPIYNIIGEINPENPERILLAAHWDTRAIAEKDADESKRNQPIDGANDGASGVGVLLEIAKQIKQNGTKKGIDIIFFDVEDQGDPTGETQNSWCLGAQYWSKNPHKENYRASYGILLDMVGSGDAVFKFENYAYSQAGPLYHKTWNTAAQLGYGYLFIPQSGGGVTDDHVYVMMNRKFPMIDIIDLDQTRANGHGFGDYHHTHNDNISGIDKNTLQAVGETVLAVILE